MNNNKKLAAQIQREFYNTSEVRRENTDRTRTKCALLKKKYDSKRPDPKKPQS